MENDLRTAVLLATLNGGLLERAHAIINRHIPRALAEGLVAHGKGRKAYVLTSKGRAFLANPENPMSPSFIPTARDLRSPIDVVIGDALADLRNVVGATELERVRAARLVVQEAAKALGWTEAAVLDAVNALAASEAAWRHAHASAGGSAPFDVSIGDMLEMLEIEGPFVRGGWYDPHGPGDVIVFSPKSGHRFTQRGIDLLAERLVGVGLTIVDRWNGAGCGTVSFRCAGRTGTERRLPESVYADPPDGAPVTTWRAP